MYMAISKVLGVGVTAYCILYCEAGAVGTNVTNKLEKTAERIAMMSVKYIDREKTLFPSGHLEAWKFPNALRVLFLMGL